MNEVWIFIAFCNVLGMVVSDCRHASILLYLSICYKGILVSVHAQTHIHKYILCKIIRSGRATAKAELG